MILIYPLILFCLGFYSGNQLISPIQKEKEEAAITITDTDYYDAKSVYDME